MASIVQRWNALGGGEEATAVLADVIQRTARFILDNHGSLFSAENEWTGWGSTLITGSKEVIVDSAQQDKRPIINSDMVVNIVTRWRERVCWLAVSTTEWKAIVPLIGGGDYLNDLIAAANSPSQVNCEAAISRFTELQAHYEDKGKELLVTILQVAVNPTQGVEK